MPKEQLKALIQEKTGRTMLYSEDLRDTKLWHAIVLEGRDILKRSGIATRVYDYLQDHGMLIRLEQDMRPIKPRPREDFVDLSDYVEELLACYPILGMATFDEQDSRHLYQIAYQAFQRLSFPKAKLGQEQQNALVINTIQLLKGWRPEEENDGSLWLFIYRQYGYKEHDDALSLRIYEGFRSTIASVMQRHQRFFAPPETQRYYTTLMLHALAPRHGFFNLFEILVRFFEKNLSFQYLQNDPSYRVFVERIKTRWGVPSELERLGLYSATMHSGLKALFLNRSDFMVFFCDSVVQKINQLLRTGSISSSYYENNYLDEMLQDWYLEKSQHTREEWTRSHRKQEGEKTVASAREANPQYAVHNGKVVLFFPNIRLDSTSGAFPQLCIYQGEDLVYLRELDVFGDELSWTIRKTQVYLDDLSIDYNQRLMLRTKIRVQDKIIFDSQERLHRSYLLFNSLGAEARPETLKRGQAYLFAMSNATLTSLGLEEANQLDHPGQLLEVSAETIQDLRIDGVEVFLPALGESNIRVYPSRAPVAGVSALKEGKEYQIYERPFSISVHLPVDESAFSYHIQHGECNASLGQLLQEGETVCELKAERTEAFLELQIKDFVTSSVVYTTRYIILQSFSLRYNEPFFLSNQSRIQGAFSWQNQEEIFSVPLQGADNLEVTSMDGRLNLRLRPPMLRCELLGKELFQRELAIWHGDIHKEVHLHPSIPNGWKANLHLGNRSLSAAADHQTFDLGNQIGTYVGTAKSEELWFSLYSPQHEPQHVPACTIYFQPMFRHPPLQVDEGKLLWSVQGNYIGDKDSCFFTKLYYRKEEYANYRFSLQNTVVERRFPFQVGRFSYQVFLETRSLFGNKQDLVFEGVFSLGDEQALRFDGQVVHLNNAICWDYRSKRTVTVMIHEKAARISDIRYIGQSIPSGETLEFPEYEGILCFYHPQSESWLPFNDDEKRTDHVLVNPVRFWPINDDMMIVYTCTEDSLYLDASRKRFLRKDPDLEMHRSLQKAILAFPDYYTYRKEEA